MNYLDVLEAIDEASGLNAKTALLKTYKDDTNLVYILDTALNFFRKFGIKNFNMPTSGPGIGIGNFIKLITKLENRELTGHAAGTAVEDLLSKASLLEQKWFSRALMKDLRIGAGTSLTAKAGIHIPEFDVMLAKDGKLSKKLEDIVSKGVWVSRKYDGYRCIAEVINYKVKLYSRNGKEYTNFPSIVDAVETFAHIMDEANFVLDGEIMSDNFQSMQKSAFASTRGTTVGDVKYFIFDRIEIDEWQSQVFKEKCSHRYEMLHNRIESVSNFRKLMNHPSLPLVEVEHNWVTSTDAISILERQYITEGFEGAMAIPDMPYYLGRKTNAMMKFKTMLTMDCTVVGRFEGEGKYEGMLGGLILTQENGETCRTGSGFTDADRSYLWNVDEKDLLGRICEIKYQDLSPDGIMRFPIMKRWRDTGSNTGKI